MPFSLVPGTIYVLILYFLSGFPASKFGFFYFNFFIFMWSAISLGQTVATFSPNPMVAYVSIVATNIEYQLTIADVESSFKLVAISSSRVRNTGTFYTCLFQMVILDRPISLFT